MSPRLYRSRRERVIAGVCGGLAEYFELDPAIVRIAFMVLIFFNGFGLLAYLLCWIALPYEPVSTPQPSETPVQLTHSTLGKRWMTALGVLLIAVGFALLVDHFLPWFSFDDILPYLLIIGGILVLYRGLKRDNHTTVPRSEESTDAP